MALISFSISENSETNDHQARVLVDGRDLLQSCGYADELGLDPPDLARELCGASAASVRIGRCSCGVTGCGDVFAAIERTAATVVWTLRPRRIIFDETIYEAEVQRLAQDESWCSLERLVERRMDAIFVDTKLDGGMAFRWASARIKPNTVNLLYERGAPGDTGHEQRLVEFDWDGETLNSAVCRAGLFRTLRFES